MNSFWSLIALLLFASTPAFSQNPSRRDARKMASLMVEMDEAVDAQARFSQIMVDKIFSFSELGFQEFETSALQR